MGREVLRILMDALRRFRRKYRPRKRNTLFRLPNIVQPRIARTYLSVVAIIKDEEPYLDEWINFHHVVGCERFFLYDNGSTDGTREILECYRDIVTWLPWPDCTPGISCQETAYAHAIASYGVQSRWMAFIDVDEFIFSPIHDSLPAALADYEDLPGLVLPWHNFGTSGYRVKPPGLVVENYKTRCAVPHPLDAVSYARMQRAKSIIDPCCATTVSAHRFMPGDQLFTPDRKVWSSAQWKPSETDAIVLNHYFSRSLAEFETKIAKGAVGKDNVFQSKYAIPKRAMLAAIEAAPVQDLRIQTWVPRLKVTISARGVDSSLGNIPMSNVMYSS